MSVICETVKIMGVIIKFEDVNDDTTLETYVCDTYVLGLSIDLDGDCKVIHLDVDTAVKFSKELRRQIALLKDALLNSEDNE